MTDIYPNAAMRGLKYPLTRSDSSVVQIDPAENAGFLNWPTTDETERVNVTLNLSLQEYVALASCVYVGQDIAYGDDGYKIWFIWSRSIMTTICQQVADCILNDTATQSAMVTALLNQGIIDPNTVDPNSTTVNDRMSTTEQQTGIKSDPDGCDLDTLWAGCKEVVLRLDDNAKTLLEDAQVLADKAERFADIVAAIPVIGNVLSTTLKTFIDTIPDLYDSFNAYSSTSNIENLTCQLFDLVCSECRYPTFQEVAETIATDALPIFANWQTVTMSAVVAQLVETGLFTPSLVWHSMLMFELVVFYLGARFVNVSGTQALTIWAELGEDEPSNDWLLLCGECGTTSYTAAEQDFTQGLGQWAILPPRGTLVAGGIQSDYYNGAEKVYVYIHSDTAWQIAGIEAHFTKGQSNSSGDTLRIYGYDDVVNNINPIEVLGYSFLDNIPDAGTYDVCELTAASHPARNDWMFLFDEHPEGDTVVVDYVRVWAVNDNMPIDITLNANSGCP